MAVSHPAGYVYDVQSGTWGPPKTTAAPAAPTASKPATPAAPAAPAGATISPNMSLADIKKYVANPSSIPSAGSYGEGQAYNAVSIFQALKQQVSNGTLNLTDYQQLAGQLGKGMAPIIRSIGGKGSAAASAVSGAWNQLNGTFMDGNGKPQNPFSQQELAALPNNVLPTQADIDSGKFDQTGMALQRVQSTPNAPANVKAPQPTAAPQPTMAPTPTVAPKPAIPAPATPAPVNPATPAAPVPVAPPVNPLTTAPNTVTAGNNAATTIAHNTTNAQVAGAPVYSANPNDPGPNGGLKMDNSQASVDAGQIANEGALQQQLATQAQQGITAQRQKYLQDLTGILNDNANKQMSEATPGIMEDLNSRGLLRSSDLGNQLAIKSKSLNADVANQLAQQGISGETLDLGNLTNIQNTYDQSRNSALQRQFSVEDYNNQLQAGKDMGAQYASLTPQAPSTKNQVEVAAAGGVAQGATAKAAKSDLGLKMNMMNGDELAEEFLNSISPVAYNYKDEKHGRGMFLGILAQDMERSFVGREIVEDAKDGKQLNPWKLVSALVGCIAHLNSRLREIEKGV